MLAMHTSVLAHYLLDPASVDERERASFLEQREWAWREAADGAIFGVANSEHGAGGDVKKSRAEVRDGRLSGVKSFCSMSTTPRWFMAAARDEASAVQYFLVENDPSHVSVAGEWDAVGMRSSESVELRFDRARVVAPLAYRGLIDGANNRHWATLAFTAIFVGAAEALEGEVRGRGGVLMAAEAVNLHLAVQASRAFLRHCTASEPSRPDAEYRRLVRDCKLFVAKTLAERATAVAIASGGSAYRFSAPVSRIYRDILAAPAVRPPLSLGFDEVWEELGDSSAA